MNDWNDWQIFATVAELGSFTRAGERLARPKSSVSAALARLEQQLGVRLIERSTRRLRLTEDGAQLYREAQPLFQRLNTLAEEAGSVRDEPHGVLRIATPYEFGTTHLSESVCQTLRAYPALAIEVEVVSGSPDPASQEYDIVFVMTSELLPDSSLVARRVYTLARGLYAAPALVAARGSPRHPSELAQWPAIMTGIERRWRFSRRGESENIDVTPICHLHTASAAMRQTAVLAGLGITIMSRTYAQPALASGELVALLEDFQPTPLRVYALLPERRLLPAKTRAFMACVEKNLFQAEADE